ncbi:SpvB/TcaC N-terminal domain-containing protein [Dokdonella sp.]|uniref:SpvB/TcaC N-terminal domain-containing protein n=1 Tax=Dokdonella sp. TaxID=2291710 RepID=UPI00321F8FBC
MQGIHSPLSRASVFLSFSPFVSSSPGPNRSVAGRTPCKPHRGHTPFAPLLATLLLTLGAGSSWMSAPVHGFDAGPAHPVPAAVADVAPAHDATVGAAAGESGVSGGAAVYTIPVAVPPGRAGMQPSVSLNYSSRGGNGIAGMGWSLSASSAIHRCAQTVEQDGRIKGVALGADDRLCLDGQRLVRVAGSAYGSAGAEYRTEIDSYARITQYGGLLQGRGARRPGEALRCGGRGQRLPGLGPQRARATGWCRRHDELARREGRGSRRQQPVLHLREFRQR